MPIRAIPSPIGAREPEWHRCSVRPRVHKHGGAPWPCCHVAQSVLTSAFAVPSEMLRGSFRVIISWIMSTVTTEWWAWTNYGGYYVSLECGLRGPSASQSATARGSDGWSEKIRRSRKVLVDLPHIVAQLGVLSHCEYDIDGKIRTPCRLAHDSVLVTYTATLSCSRLMCRVAAALLHSSRERRSYICTRKLQERT